MSRLCLGLMMIIFTACGTSNSVGDGIDTNSPETSTDVQADGVRSLDSEDALTELVEDELTVVGPDGHLSFTVAEKNLSGVADYPEQQRLYYRLERDGVLILDWSPLGIVTAKHSFLDDLDLQTVQWTQVDRTYATPTGKRRLHREHFNQATIGVQNPDGAPLELEVRVFDDAAAFRYRLLGVGNARITEELTGFRLVEGVPGWLQSMPTIFEITPPGYEFPYDRASAGDPGPSHGFVFPALFRTSQDEDSAYVLLTEAGLSPPYAATRLSESAEDGLYRIRFPSPEEGVPSADTQPVGPLPFETPWRVVIAGGLGDIVQSDAVLNLASPTTTSNSDWIHPGRSAWSWWSQETGDPELQREYIDFASEMGWEYILVDAKWDQWPDAEQAVTSLCEYGKQRDVGVFLWYNSSGPQKHSLKETPIDRMYDAETRREEMERLSKWGVKGIKVDFFNSDKPARIRQYLDILEDAWKTRLMVNFHGCTVPKGWRRTWPNLMTMEAVGGAEFFKFPITRGPSATDHIRYVFTRNVVGPMDYTPVVFEKALEKQGQTYAHQLALSVLFESGLQHFADNADADPSTGYRAIFEANPELRKFLSEVPVVWDDVVYLDGHPDTHVVLARRSGDDWYIAGIAVEEASPIQLHLDLELVSPGPYSATLISSGDAPDKFSIETLELEANTLDLTLSPNDGFVVVLQKP